MGLPQGLALLVQRGLPAWLAAWRRWVPARPVLAGPVGESTGGSTAPGRERDLVEVLLSMALGGRKEADR
jgi:hypothetical protein